MGGSVYILAYMRRGRTSIGVTNNLVRRTYEHREGLVAGYTRAYNIRISKRLARSAIERETPLKRWYRHWKQALIE